MPGIALHLLCARRVLDRWRTGPEPAPFCLHDPSAVEAFFQGAVGPDMGYFGGGRQRISDLAHRVRSADLARAMLQCARDPVQSAFAWGWVTHLLADVAVHPLINRATGELIHGGASRPVTAGESPATHLRIELGLDAYILSRHPAAAGARFRCVLPGRRVRFLATAFRRTYGQGVGAAELAGAQAAVLRLAPLVLLLGRATGEVHRGARHRPGPARAMERSGPAGPPPREDALAVVRGFLTPIPPRPWLVREVRRVLRGFAGTFLDHHRTGLRNLANHDLDTGAEAPATNACPAVSGTRPDDRALAA